MPATDSTTDAAATDTRLAMRIALSDVGHAVHFLSFVLALIDLSVREAHFEPSLMYCVRFLDPLREKFGNFYRTADFADLTDEAEPRRTGHRPVATTFLTSVQALSGAISFLQPDLFQ
jgi:hypothetical protein